MAVETGQAIITAIYNRLNADSTLQTTLGKTVESPCPIYRWPNLPNDPALPYFAQRLDAVAWPLSDTDYFLDLYWYGADSATVDSAIERIRVLLENWRITTGDSEIGAGRIVFNPIRSGYVETDNPFVWHYGTGWQISFVADRLTGLIG